MKLKAKKAKYLEKCNYSYNMVQQVLWDIGYRTVRYLLLVSIKMPEVQKVPNLLPGYKTS